MNDLIERKSIRNLYSCLNPNDRVLVGQVLIDIDAIPSVDVPITATGIIDAIREAEYRGYMKAVEDIPKWEWIETSDGTICGNCHKFPYDDGEYHIANWYSDFCPNCGARMLKGADDE